MRTPRVSWLFLIPFYSTCLCISSFLTSSYCLDDQQSLLLQLKNNLTFTPAKSKKLVHWNQIADCCQWNGVTCKEGSVTGLDLSHESISGGIDNSSSLFRLQYLQNLNLAYNNFSSVIPYGFHKLTKLRYLNLSNAGFMGQIPIEISQLIRLVTLDISSLSDMKGPVLKLKSPNLKLLVQNHYELAELYLDNAIISVQGTEWGHALSSSLPKLRVLSMSSCNLSSPIDASLTKLQSLSVIHLDLNNLSATVPEFFANFTNLTTLNLSSCGLVGTFPQIIFQRPTLQVLDVSNNKDLRGSFSEFPHETSLQNLIVSDTNFSGVLPDSVSNLRQISRLQLSGCQFNGCLPNSMSKLAELVYVDLSNNSFTGPIPTFNMSKSLSHIDLSHNQYNGEIPLYLFSLSSLQTIQLSNNQLDGQLLEFSDVFSSVLDTLDLSSNNLEGTIPTSIFQVRSITILQLSSNKFNGTIHLDLIGRLENLTTLNLSHNNLSINTTVSYAQRSSFPRIRILKLSSCMLREFPGFLKNQTNLIYLDLSNKQIQGIIPNWIWELGFVHLNLSHNMLIDLEGPLQSLHENLVMLDLHSNQLQGPIPILGPYVSYFDYSNNNFSSVIPPDIGSNLLYMMFFSLSRNNIYGRIPESICDAPNLQVLDLSQNNFNGTIPQCLMGISETLGVLNLQGNNLGGSISGTFPKTCSLKTLNLNGNQLQGKIPKSLPNCMALEVLDLGKNQIAFHAY